MNLEELKRLYAERLESADGTMRWASAMVDAFPAIVAKLEAADRFSNEVESEVTSFLGYGDDGVVGDANVVRAVQIMRTKLEAAQRLRDAIAAQHCNGACVGNGKSILVRNALATFDKETA